MKRAWIIGNGPSLNSVPLHLLKDEDCFGLNRIHLIYPYTEWRPKYYVLAEAPPEYTLDDMVIENIGRAFEEGLHCYMQVGYRGFVERKSLRKKQEPKTVEEYFTTCQHTYSHYDNGAPEAWHLPELCGFGSSLHVAMQIAVKLGYEQICLVGCDLGYVDGGVNHFNKDYDKGFEDKLRPAKYANEDNLLAHRIAAASCPVPIIDCTVDSKLDMYPKSTIEEVLNGAGLQPGSRIAREPQVDGDKRDEAAVEGSGEGRAVTTVWKRRSVDDKGRSRSE